MSQTWITSALAAGGTLTMKCAIPGKRIILARMDWPGENPVSGNISTTPEGALENPDAALQEDAGNEMMENGDV